MGPEIPLLGIHSKDLKADLKKYLYTHVYSSIIHNNQEVGAAYVFIDR